MTGRSQRGRSGTTLGRSDLACSRMRERFSLLIRKLLQGGLDAFTLEPQPRVVFRRARGGSVDAVGQGLGASTILAPHEVDRATMNERQQPRARFAAFRDEPVGVAPRGEKPFLHRVLGEPLVTKDP